MDIMTSTSHVASVVGEILEGVEWISSVVLFGSMARGEAHADSDVDLAIVTRQVPALQAELELQRQLEHRLGRDVDIVLLAQANLSLRWRVARDGVLVYGSESEWKAFQTRVAIEHADMQPVLTWATERFRRSLAQGEHR